MASHINKSKKKFQPKGQTRREPSTQVSQSPSEDRPEQITLPNTTEEVSTEQSGAHLASSAAEARPILPNSTISKALNNTRTPIDAQLENSHAKKHTSLSSIRRPTTQTTGSKSSQTNTKEPQSRPSASISKEPVRATRSLPKSTGETRTPATPQSLTQKRKRKPKQGRAEEDEQTSGTGVSSVKRRKTAARSRTRTNGAGDTEGQGRDRDQRVAVDEENDDAGPTRQTRKSSSTPGRKRKVTPDNAEDLIITPTDLKMSELCDDRQQGRLSSREMRLRDRDKELAEQKKQSAQKKARQEAQQFMDNPEGSSNRAGTTEEPAQSSSSNSVRTASPPSNGNQDNEPATLMTKIVNGQIVPIESSYIIDRHQQAHNLDPDDSASIIVEDDLTKRINSATYGKRRGPSGRWTMDMDELFYDGLRYFGMDFTMIQTLFPKKSRQQIKKKFIKEQRADLNFINQVLLERKPVPGAEELQERSGKQLREPSEVYEELAENEAQLRAVHEKEEEAQKAAQRQRDKQVEEEGARLGAAIASKKAKHRSIEVNSDTDFDVSSDMGSESDLDAENDTRTPSTKKAPDKRKEVENAEDEAGSDLSSDDAMNGDAPNEDHDPMNEAESE